MLTPKLYCPICGFALNLVLASPVGRWQCSGHPAHYLTMSEWTEWHMNIISDVEVLRIMLSRRAGTETA